MFWNRTCDRSTCRTAEFSGLWHLRSTPADTLRNNDVVITSKRRHFDVITSKWRRFDVITITSKWRRFDVITTLLLRHVFSGTCQGRWSTLDVGRPWQILRRDICIYQIEFFQPMSGQFHIFDLYASLTKPVQFQLHALSLVWVYSPTGISVIWSVGTRTPFAH